MDCGGYIGHLFQRLEHNTSHREASVRFIGSHYKQP
jgi:hypothetical protein